MISTIENYLHPESEMPFGEHKGKKMKDVPEEYLLELYDRGTEFNVWTDNQVAVRTYIQDYLF